MTHTVPRDFALGALAVVVGAAGLAALLTLLVTATL